ncbi:GyrI-like domain-containing protein [Bacteroides congonensis]
MIESEISKKYCQSCGMPLRFDVEKYLGTNSDGSRSDEYCYYCLKDGKYIVDIPMSEMINIWIKYTDKYNEYANTTYSPEELRIILNGRLPKLKRWKQKLETSNIHHQKIQDIIVHINNHLFDSLDTDMLSDMSGLSKYHFRRVFQTVSGENIGSYIQRLRLEHIAHLLVSTDFTINQILEQTNYQTKFSLAKAFKKHFKITTSQYREEYKPMHDEQHTVIVPEIWSIQPMKIFYIEVGEKYKDELRYKLIWNRLINYAKQYNESKSNYKFVSVSMDDPSITPMDKCRFYLGVTTDNNMTHDSQPGIMEIPGGRYAIFRHTGDYSLLHKFYRRIYEEWFPKSKYRPQSPFSFEMYMNHPDSTLKTELITDIYIPVVKK